MKKNAKKIFQQLLIFWARWGSIKVSPDKSKGTIFIFYSIPKIPKSVCRANWLFFAPMAFKKNSP